MYAAQWGYNPAPVRRPAKYPSPLRDASSLLPSEMMIAISLSCWTKTNGRTQNDLVFHAKNSLFLIHQQIFLSSFLHTPDLQTKTTFKYTPECFLSFRPPVIEKKNTAKFLRHYRWLGESCLEIVPCTVREKLALTSDERWTAIWSTSGEVGLEKKNCQIYQTLSLTWWILSWNRPSYCPSKLALTSDERWTAIWSTSGWNKQTNFPKNRVGGCLRSCWELIWRHDEPFGHGPSAFLLEQHVRFQLKRLLWVTSDTQFLRPFWSDWARCAFEFPWLIHDFPWMFHDWSMIFHEFSIWQPLMFPW